MSDDTPPDVDAEEGGDSVAENGGGLQATLAGLPAGDRQLLWGFILASLFTLGLGVLYALVLVMVKGGFIELESTLAYTVLTLHAIWSRRWTTRVKEYSTTSSATTLSQRASTLRGSTSCSIRSTTRG